jgi:hypothetical protein
MRASIVLIDLNGKPKFTIKHSSVGVDLIIHTDDKETKIYISSDELQVFINALEGRV